MNIICNSIIIWIAFLLLLWMWLQGHYCNDTSIYDVTHNIIIIMNLTRNAIIIMNCNVINLLLWVAISLCFLFQVDVIQFREDISNVTQFTELNKKIPQVKQICIKLSEKLVIKFGNLLIFISDFEKWRIIFS